MNKLLTKIVGVALGATMAVGVGVGVAVNNSRDVVDSQVNAAADNRTWDLVTDASTLAANDIVTFVSNTSTKYVSQNVANETGAASYIKYDSTSVTISNNTISNLDATTHGFVLEGNSTAWKFKSLSENASYSGKYLYKTTTGKNTMGADATSNATGTGWTISISNNVATITSTNLTTYSIKYNSNSGQQRFSTYTTGQNSIFLYRARSTAKTVANVTGVASHPTEVIVGNSINPSDVTLNVTYTDSTSGTVQATSVSCDTSVAKSDVTATATYSPATGTKTATFSINVIEVPGYELVNDVQSLRNGAKAVIHSTSATYKMIMTSQNTDYRNASTFTVSNDFIPTADLPAASEVFTLVISGSHWELKTSDDKYLSLTSNNNKLYTSTNIDTENNTTEWDISFSGNNAVITSVAHSNRVIRLNGSSTRFACYEGTQQAIQLYVLKDNSPYFTVNNTSVYLGNRGSQSLELTAHNGASDNVTWASDDTDIATVSPTNGMSTTVTACNSGTGVATITASFESGEFDPIEVRVEVMELDSYVTIGVTMFTKVSSNAGDWSGTYLIVDETASKIFDGSASPLIASSEKGVTISSNTIAATGLIPSSFNIKASSHGYTLKSNSNYYVGNRSTSKGIMTSLGVHYEVSIASDGTITALLEDGTSSSTTLRHNNTDGIFRFYDNTSGNALSLYKANGEVRAISSTITAWYDDAKANGYLNCNMSGSGSSIDFDALYDSAILMLDGDDYDTLKRMSSKSAEDNGNYLEDFISDYDYLVMNKGYDDFLDRFKEGGAMYGASRLSPNSFNGNVQEKNTIIALVVILSLVGLVSVGGYFLLRKRKEER